MTKAETLLGGYEAGAVAAGLTFRCARCGEELTDPASIQHGWGPVCRKLANEAYAKMIPANPVAALVSLNTTSLTSGAEGVKGILLALRTEVVKGMESGRTDWRGTVHCLVRLVSIAPAWWKAGLCDAVGNLGYHVLAEVARENASPSIAELSVANDRLVLKSKRNKAAVVKIRAVKGRYFDILSKTWTFPVTALKEVVEIVETYYPMSKVNVMELLRACAAANKAAPPKLSVSMVEVEGRLEITTPYNAHFVSDLKASIPYKFRGWDPAKKVWWVDSVEAAIAKILVNKHFAVPAEAA